MRKQIEPATKHIIVTKRVHALIKEKAARNRMFMCDFIEAAVAAYDREKLSKIDLDKVACPK